MHVNMDTSALPIIPVMMVVVAASPMAVFVPVALIAHFDYVGWVLKASTLPRNRTGALRGEHQRGCDTKDSECLYIEFSFLSSSHGRNTQAWAQGSRR